MDVNVSVQNAPIQVQSCVENPIQVNLGLPGIQGSPGTLDTSQYLTSGQLDNLFLTPNEGSGFFYSIHNPNRYSTSGNVEATGIALFNIFSGFTGNQNVNIGVAFTGVRIEGATSTLTGLVTFSPGNYIGVGQSAVGITISSTAPVPQTGQALQNSINTLSGNLTNSGQTLDTKINSLSGYTNSTFATGMGNVIFVDRAYGNDSSARIGSLAKPFKTLSGAQNSWVSGYTIHVLPGVYNESLGNQPNGIKWNFYNGAIVDYTGNNNSIFTIPYLSDVVIDGQGVFKSRATGNHSMIFDVNGGNLILNGLDCLKSNAGFGVWQRSGYSVTNFTNLLSGGEAGAYWGQGECSTRADTIAASTIYSVGAIYSENSSSGNWWINANHIYGGTIYGPDYSRVWIDTKQITNKLNCAGARTYLRAEKLNPGTATDTTLVIGGGIFWGQIQKITAGTQNAVEVGNSNTWLEFTHIEDINNIATELIKINGAFYEENRPEYNIYIKGLNAVAGSGANGILFNNGQATISINKIDTRNNISGQPIKVVDIASEVNLHNCCLLSYSGQPCIDSDGGNFNVRILGTLTANTNVSSTIALQNGIFNLTGIKSQFNDTITIPRVPPTGSNGIGFSGQLTWDTGFFYVCIANNTWKRVSLSTW